MFRRIWRLLICLTVTLALVVFYIPAQVAQANINSCEATVFQHSVTQGSVAHFQFQITNTDPSSIHWIKITRPSNNFVIISATVDSWVGDSNSESATFHGGSIDSGTSNDQIYIDAIPTTAAPAASWSVQVSDDQGGTNPFACSGDLATAITAPGPNISNIAVSNISATSVTITWDTDTDSTSQVNYGLDDNYGSSSPTDSNAVTSHSVKLTNLAANTGYHFQVVSAVPAGGSTTSGDSTFLTAVEQEPVTKFVNVPGLAIQITNPSDKTPPTINISSKLPKVVKAISAISGTATDDSAVVRVEYSTDGGRDWLPVDSATGLGGKQVTFSFTPINLDDGNYNLVARAIDSGGNVAKTTPITIVVDRLPPLVGGNVISIGPQILEPNKDGILTTVVGVDQKITTSTVGGATSLNLAANRADGQAKMKNFGLTRNVNSGLWSGILSFEEPGTYDLVANSVDGAGNKTTKAINSVYVSVPAHVVKQGSKQPATTGVTVYYLEPDTNSWVVWDGAAYGQKNPQTTAKNGNFSLFLPPGSYYLKASAKNFQPVISNSFKLGSPTPILSTLTMKPKHSLNLGPIHIPWPNFSIQKIDLQPRGSKLPKTLGQNDLIGKDSPNFSLSSTNGQTISATGLLGRPTVLSFLSTWAPSTNEQLSALSELQVNKDINAELIALQESSDKLRAFNQIGGYQINWLADPDSTLSNVFNPPSLPTHYFIDRKGVIKLVISGVLSKQELLNDLSAL